jgi:hypothetical protein
VRPRFFTSDLTREHLREVVRLFIGAQPGSYLVPFGRLGIGPIKLLVFALLTFIAEPGRNRPGRLLRRTRRSTRGRL